MASACDRVIGIAFALCMLVCACLSKQMGCEHVKFRGLKNVYRFQCDSDRDLIWLEWSAYQHRVNETVGALDAWVVRGAT